MTSIVRWLCDPSSLEAIEGDLAELYGGRPSWRHAWDVASICLRQPRNAVRFALAALIVLVVAGPIIRPARYTVYASDPAGAFQVEIHYGRAVAARLGGVPVRERDLVQIGDTLVIRGGNHGADFPIAIQPTGGISWSPRRLLLP